MTMPKGWKNEQTTISKKEKENSNEQKEQISSKNGQTSSTIITVEDKIIIQELIAKHNIALDNKNIDEWTNSWTDNGVWSTPFGEAKGNNRTKKFD
jgi:hypothetical protein